MPGLGIGDTLSKPPPTTHPLGLKPGRLFAGEKLSDDIGLVIVDAAAIAASG